jgi:hypothetical protein
MAVLGAGGKLLLKRQAPEPCLINPEAVDPEGDIIFSICDGYWTGDHISSDCLPYSDGKFPPGPHGYATYFGSKFFLGPNRDQITSSGDEFYKTGSEDYPDGQFGEDSQFYCRAGDVSDGEEIFNCRPGDYWIHIDPLGHVSFYKSRCDALSGCKTTRLNLVQTNTSFSIAPFGSLEYRNAVWECIYGFGEYTFGDAQDTVTLISICADAPRYEIPTANPNTEAYSYDNANLTPRGLNQGKGAPFWQVLCEIREWSLELSAPSVDTTSVAEKFGNAVKSLVTGGGSTEFFIDRLCFNDNEDNGLLMMKLLMMTEKGCEASAQFYMLERGEGCGADCDLIRGSLYYETDILITQTAVNLRPTELVAGTAQFVTTGDIRLLEAP